VACHAPTGYVVLGVDATGQPCTIAASSPAGSAIGGTLATGAPAVITCVAPTAPPNVATLVVQLLGGFAARVALASRAPTTFRVPLLTDCVTIRAALVGPVEIDVPLAA
jgi:hypothetical protein